MKRKFTMPIWTRPETNCKWTAIARKVWREWKRYGEVRI
jgi:hypothetical protein